MKRLIFAFALLLGTCPVAVADAPNPSAYDLIYFGESGPVLLRLNVEVDGKSVQSAFADYMKRWVDYLDHDKDGKLNANEAQWLPNRKYASSFFRNGYFVYNPSYAPKMSEFGKGANDKLTVEDVVAYYEGNNVAALQRSQNVGNRQVDTSSKVLFEQIDENSDGKLSKDELAAGVNALRKYDLDDDEIITKQEVSGTTTPNIYYGRGGFGGANRPGKATTVNPASSSIYLVQPNKNRLQISAVILARYDKNKDTKISKEESGLDQSSFKAIDKDGNNFITIDELTRWHTSAGRIGVTIRLGNLKAGQRVVELDSKTGKLPPGIKVTHSGDDNVHLLFPDAKVALIGKGVNSKSMAATNSGMALTYTRYFQAANPKNKAFLTLQELQGKPQATYLFRLFPVIDANTDGKMTINEVYDFTKLVSRAKYVVSSLQISEEGQAVFELLDNNRDNRLSPRELLTAWKNLGTLDRNKDNVLDGKEFSKHYSIVLQRGQSVYYVNNNGRNVLTRPKSNQPKSTAPIWFQRMDANDDGDISQREFLGTRSQFQQIDADGDGLIDPQEATSAASTTSNTKSN